MKKALGIFAAAIAALYIASPYYTVYRLDRGLQEKDQEAIRERIDFESLRSSLKDQINGRMMSEMSKKEDIKDNPLAAGFALFLAPKLIDGMIDTVVSPAGVTALLSEGDTPEDAPQGNTSSVSKTERPAIAYAFFEGIDQFKVILKKKDSDDTIRLRLERQGLGWKLTKVWLPE